MISTLNVYRDRINEIELYLSAIKQLYDTKDKFNEGYDFHSEDFLKMLKANALLMVYNLVEASIMGGILEIYDQMKTSGHSYNDVRKEIRDIWFSYKFNQVYDKSADYNSYREKALEIINAIIGSHIIELNRKAADINGNLDSQKIRQICKDHGIVYSVDASCKGGVVLDDVKEKRNYLAHGTISFVECGRDYSIEELISIKEQTVTFLNGILGGMKNYYDEKRYLISVV